MALRSVSMQQQAGGGNPFGGGGQQTTALAMQGQTVGVPVKLPNGVTVMMASQSDATAMQTWYAGQKQAAMSLDGGGSSSGGGDGMNRALGMAADGAQALSGFLAGRDFTSKLNDFHDAQDRVADIRDELVRSTSGTTVSPQQLVRLIDAQQAANDAQVAVLETMITAVDIQAGAGAAKVIGRFLNGDSSSGGGGGGMSNGATAALAIGGVGLGAVLLSRNSTTNSTRRRGR